MIKKISNLFLLVLITISYSCFKTQEPIEVTKTKENNAEIEAFIKAKNIGATKNADGFYTLFTKTNPTGRVPAVGDLVKYQFSTANLNGIKIDSSTKANPRYFPYGTIISNSLSYCTSLLKEGESITIYLDHSGGYGGNARPNLPAYSPIVLNFSLEKLSNEDEQIENYILDNKINGIQKTATGLRYAITSPKADGIELKKGNLVTIKYTGKLLYFSSILDANRKITNVFDSGSFDFTLGSGGVIAGFDEGVAKLKVGEKGILLIPSVIGYQDKAQGEIPAKSPLFFEIEVVAAK
jgi:FKBP-type peptidyl-prolyl cis-trans isomerase